MADEEEHLGSCAECGATIYPEHLEKHVAGTWEDKLLCHHCLEEKRSAAIAAEQAEDEPVALVEEELPGLLEEEPTIAYDKKPTAIRSFGSGPEGMSESFTGLKIQQDLRRPLLRGSQNATRCRTFHCKLTDAALAHMNEQVNEWADSDDDIEIKFAMNSIGVVEGKHTDPHLIVTVFY